MSYKITIQRYTGNQAPDSPAIDMVNVYQQDFDDLDLSSIIRKLNEPTRKPRADRGKTRAKASA